ncbi:beta-N-acetylhexosaminidase [Marinoscillum furvescens]|uniref:Hexosaminidase n=1 Tax=Marinoscillum furvescens DSM 4134 TaxID=1122208 RepID=A0A3D9LHQ4_MARFU|nr:family 20 glycosylhydrolase [Marinoscillum furvescens]REE05941.1 hexosaminidase [Marinoscillum furvescens DSM 4134]
MSRSYIFVPLVLFVLVSCLPAKAQYVNVMPYPQKVDLQDKHYFIAKDFTIALSGDYRPRLAAQATRFLRRLDEQTGLFFQQFQVDGSGYKEANLKIRVEKKGEVLPDMKEAYELTIDDGGLHIIADTDIGAIRALETLLQLVEVREGRYAFPYVQIQDAPRFSWRGLMLDVARHFMPLEVIYRNLDAMAALKLNVLHLHLSDDQGFRIATETYPELTELGSDGLFYTKAELQKIINYAAERGIRVVPEIDVPGHATAILVSHPELGSADTTYQIQRYAGIFDPTLDPTNEAVYEFLENLFEEVAAIFPDPYFHIGGDENMGRHWDANEKIQAFMQARGIDTNHELQTYFNIRIEKILADQNKITMGWEEIMTPDMPKSALIHSWRGAWEGVTPKASLYAAARSGYDAILSNGYYLDLMMTAEEHYLMDPAPASVDLDDEARSHILGGEMCMWSELVTEHTIDSRLWPRGAAIAERLWSAEEVNDVDEMYRRLSIVNQYLERLHLKHVSEPKRILRQLAAGHDPKPLETLLEVVEPMKGYTRNPGGTMYASYSPFTLWADAATADARVARVFNEQVEAFLKGEALHESLKTQLITWEANHDQVVPIIEDSPVLKQISNLSANLSEAAKSGRVALEAIVAQRELPAEWVARARKQLVEARANGGRTELQMLEGVERLLDQVDYRRSAQD